MRSEGPDHYKKLSPEPIDVIRSWELPWCPANALKYIARYRNKGGIEDLKKARHYLDMEIEAMETASPLAGDASQYFYCGRCADRLRRGLALPMYCSDCKLA